MRILLAPLLALATTLTVNAAPTRRPCTVTTAMFDIYQAPTTASSQESTAARRAATDLMSSACFDRGPEDPAQRAIVFRLLEQEMLLDYDQLFAAREKRTGTARTESAFEGALFFQQDFLQFIDRIVTPADAPHRAIILTYASGLAIAKLGRAVKGDVFHQAGTPPKAFYGLVQQSPQTEALRALGYWLDPDSPVLTPAERTEYARVIATALPSDGFLREDFHIRFVMAALEALGRSDSAEAEDALRTWHNLYQANYGSGDSIEILAQESADRIRARRTRRK
jgi:hypothetical protein